jgi:hypothetical protein
LELFPRKSKKAANIAKLPELLTAIPLSAPQDRRNLSGQKKAVGSFKETGCKPRRSPRKKTGSPSCRSYWKSCEG